MSDKLQQATTLITEQKYKKALTIVKKYNSKLAAQSFISHEAEGVCLYHLKKYVLAEMAFEKSLKKASNNKEVINALANLKSSAFFANKSTQCIDYLKQIIVTDSSINTAKFRFELCKLSYLAGDFITVVEYVSKLTNFSEYAIEGGILAIQAHAELAQHEALSMALVKFLPELDKVSKIQLNELLSTLFKCKEKTALNQIMALVKDKFSHQDWFQGIQNSIYKQVDVPPLVAPQTLVKPPRKIVGESKEIVETITELVTLLEEQGAVFHDELYFIEHHGNLSIQSFAQDGNKLMSVPIKCMPLLSDYQLSLNHHQIVCTQKENPKNSFADQSMQLLIKLYNQTNKVNTWNNTHPFLALRHEPEFLTKFLLNLVNNVPKIKNYADLLAQGDQESLFLKTFIGSREFNLTKDALEKMQIQTAESSELALLSVIDFLNHSAFAPGYIVDNESLNMEFSSTDCHSPSEVFVNYNHIDFVLTYFIYGFVDKHCPILYSCETNLTCLNGVVIEIIGSAGRASEQSSTAATHLQNYLPASCERRHNNIKLNSLIIPNTQAIHTLKQVLKYILLKFDIDGHYLDEKNLESKLFI
jgi:tetratricopeptide (TPR) repeat protein